MRFCSFSTAEDRKPRLGMLLDEYVVEPRELLGGGGAHDTTTLLGLIEAGPELWERLLAAASNPSWGSIKAHRWRGVRLHAPIPRPRKNVVCLGLNYVNHMKETARARGREVKAPEVPVFFTKAVTAVNGPFEDIIVDARVTREVDYEVELGVIIGRSGRNIPRSEALSYVFGYTVVNDFSARDLQQRHGQWYKGKSLDTFCPMGPYVVTSEEFGDPQNKKLSLRVNGVVRQEANTAEMIFPVASIIEYLSQGMTLEAGDIISTGTPEGVGLGRVPPEYLQDGDIVEAEVEGIGSLRNRVVMVS